MQARLLALERKFAARFAGEIAEAGIFHRLYIRFLIYRRIRRKWRNITEGPYCLFLNSTEPSNYPQPAARRS
jgi:hypothetical protein